MSQSWIQHALRRGGWQPQRQATALAVMGVIISLIVGALYLSQVAADATKNRALETLIQQRNELERTNEQIRAEIASLRTVPHLLARAQELGFVPATGGQIEYLVVDGYNPNRPVEIAPAKPAENLPTYDETFGGWLQQQLDNLRGQFDSFSKQGSQ